MNVSSHLAFVCPSFIQFTCITRYNVVLTPSKDRSLSHSIYVLDDMLKPNITFFY